MRLSRHIGAHGFVVPREWGWRGGGDVRGYAPLVDDVLTGDEFERRYGTRSGSGRPVGRLGQVRQYNQAEEVIGGIVAAEASDGFWHKVKVGVVTGLLIYAGHRVLDRVWPRGEG